MNKSHKNLCFYRLMSNSVKKHSLFLIFVIMLLAGANAQNSLYLEVGGSGGLGSLNFERTFRNNSTTAFSWSAGFSMAPIDKNNGTALVFPLMMHLMYGSSPHKLEFGIGQGFSVTTKGNAFALGTLAIGYRHDNPNKFFYWRIAYTPLVSWLIDWQYQHWAGISIGIHLN